MVLRIPGRSRSVSPAVRGLTLVVGSLGVDWHGQHDLVQREGHVGPVLAVTVVVEPLDLDVGERHEVALGRVKVVGQPASVAVLGQPQDPSDPMARRLHHDALLTMLHAYQRRYRAGVADWHPADAWPSLSPLTGTRCAGRRTASPRR